ncbi:MAG: threonylcarbamoyl-AMP synthase [Actinomycetia bacterium]|nr:threonylcarbamoyl-AMP synthase [Actinomycetes bacterium]
MTVRVTHDVRDAVAALRGGGLVALPTETVYGLAGDARSPSAIAGIFAAKGRPSTHPVIVHLPDAGVIDRWATAVPHWASSLADALWPGPLTLIVNRADDVLDAVTGGQPTVGLRVPAHPLTLEVLRQFGDGLAAPSANRYGHVSPTTVEHVMAELGEVLDAGRDVVLDGGRCPVGVESTIIGAWDDTPRLLRAGAVTALQVAEVTGREVSIADGGVRTPGTTAAHYAPTARVLAVEADAVPDALNEVVGPFGLIALSNVLVPAIDHVRLAAPANAAEYAFALYAALHAADDAGLDVVVAVLPPDAGVGHAVRDRLHRAAISGARP